MFAAVARSRKLLENCRGLLSFFINFSEGNNYNAHEIQMRLSTSCWIFNRLQGFIEFSEILILIKKINILKFLHRAYCLFYFHKSFSSEELS